MKIYIRFFLGGCKPIQVESDTITILELKQQIQEQLKEYREYRIDKLYIIYSSVLIKNTDDQKTLKDFNIGDNSYITIVLKL